MLDIIMIIILLGISYYVSTNSDFIFVGYNL
jgi:hypothetical protein